MNTNPIHWRPLRDAVGRLQKTHKDANDVARLLALEIAKNADLRMHVVHILLPDLLWAADKIGDGGPDDSGSDAHYVPVPSPILPSKSSDGSGLSSRANGGQTASALPSGSNRDGGGLSNSIGNDLAQPAPPSRSTPKAIDPNLRTAIIKEGAKTASILFKLHDGADIMKVHMRELPHYRALGAKQAAVCDRILKHSGNAQPDHKVGDVITATTLEKYVKDAEREVNALV